MSRWILKLSFCSSNPGMKTSAPLINAIVNTVSYYTPTHASNRFRLKSFTSCAFVVDSLPQISEWNVLRPVLFGGQKSGSSTVPLLHIQTGGANDAQNVSIDTACGKDNDQQNLKKMIIWYCRIYNQIASDVWRYNYPIYKLMTNNEQTATGVN